MLKRVGKSFFIITNKMKRYLDKELQPLNITANQSRILRYLYRNKDKIINQNKLVEEFQIRGASVTGLLDKLISQKLIKRTQDINDKRKKILSLTKEGEEIALKSFESTDKFEEIINTVITTNEKEDLFRILTKIEEMLDEKEKTQ